MATGIQPVEQSHMLAGTSYDANGQLLTDTFHAYTWNACHRPVTIDIGTCGTSGSCYTYDALGRVVECSFNNIYMELLYSPLGFAARMGGQTLQVACASLPGGQQAWLKPTEQRFWFKDWLGTVRLASVRGTRAIDYDRAFAPFGEMYATFGATDYKDFNGNMQEDLGLLDQFDTPNRYLHTGQGRWLPPDKGPFNISNPQTFNRYAYVSNSPLTFTDPAGLWINAVTFANISESAAMWNVIALGDRISRLPYGYRRRGSLYPSISRPILRPIELYDYCCC